MQVTIKKLSKSEKEGQYGPFTSIGMQTHEYGDRWINGIQDEISEKWTEGSTVDIEIKKKTSNGKEYWNFKTIEPFYADTPNPHQDAPEKALPSNTTTTTNTGGYSATVAFKGRDYEKEAEGKCRYGFALEAYKMGKKLDQLTVDVIDRWVEYSMTGKTSNVNTSEITLDDNLIKEIEEYGI